MSAASYEGFWVTHEALRLSPRDERAYLWVGLYVGGAKLHLGADEEAARWLQRSIDANRNMSVTHLFLASAFAHLGRLADARSAVQAGLALAPGYTITHFRGMVESDNPVRADLRGDALGRGAGGVMTLWVKMRNARPE